MGVTLLRTVSHIVKKGDPHNVRFVNARMADFIAFGNVRSLSTSEGDSLLKSAS